MSTQAENNKRIAKNTLFLYLRMFLTTITTLYTSRIVLTELGIVDFGIYNVVAGVVAMLGFLKSSMSLSVQRFFSYELGKKNNDSIKKIFNISLYTHVILAILIIIVAETIGLWFVKTQLVIPPDRLNAAIFIFHCVVLSSVASVIEVPFNAMLLSAEKFNIYAYVSILEVILKLIIAFSLIAISYDKLKFYGLAIMAATILVTIIYIVYTGKKFSYIKIQLLWDKSIFKNILNFSIWSLLGEIAWVFVLQGINILINLFSGPVVNAARAISYQVNSAITGFTRSFQQAINPQIIKSYAANNMEEMKKLLFKGTKLSYYLMLLFTFPLLLETNFILSLWLKEVPEHTVLFCQLVLIGGLIDGTSNLLATVAKAYGKIKNYQIIISSVLFLNFPISYIFLKFDFFPEITMYIYSGISFILLFVRLYLTKQMINLPPKEYIYNAIFPIIKVTSISSILLLSIHSAFSPSILRFFVSGISSIIIIALVSFIFGMTYKEKQLITDYIKRKIQ